ncbi:TPA: nitric oxide reductase transcription regulator, partial [Pseudomonas aeruginosa]|nr:nitric oxide reductase transcription regulator [Pseudomonas aeruginosa]
VEPAPAAPTTGHSLRAATDAYQRHLIQDCLARHQGSWASAARELGLDRANLARLARRLQLR